MVKNKKSDFKNIFITVGVLIIMSVGAYFYLSLSTQKTDQIDEAKKSLGVTTGYDTRSVSKGALNNTSEAKKIENEKQFALKEVSEINKKITSITSSYLTDGKVLTLDTLSLEDIAKKQVEITGSSKTSVDKIVVSFSNASSKFPDDRFELKKFSKGDSSFLYRAFEKFETIDLGTNRYLFEAYIGDDIEKMEVIIDIVKPEEKIIEIEKEDLPKTLDAGNPVDLGDGKISYSDIRGLEISKTAARTYSCDWDEMTLFTDDNIAWYKWWNTCRPLINDDGISFFVTRIAGTDMVYEKHYLAHNGYYWVFEIQTQANIILDNDSGEAKIEKLKQKSVEYKKQNLDFDSLERVDILFKEMAQK